MDRHKALQDFTLRVREYEKVYQPLDDDEDNGRISYIKVHPPTHPFIYQPTHPLIYPPIHLPTHPPYPSINPSTFLPTTHAAHSSALPTPP